MSEKDDDLTINFEDEAEVVEPTQPKAKHELNLNYMTKSDIEISASIALPTTTQKEMFKKLGGINVNNLEAELPEKWENAVASGNYHRVYNDELDKSVNRDGSDWGTQVDVDIDGNQKVLKGRYVNPKANGTINLANAKLLIQQKIGSGTPFHVPLFHTGIWVTFKPPGDTATVNLDQAIKNDTIIFGRSTHGAVFSNVSSYTVSRFAIHALEHVVETTAKVGDDIVGGLLDIINPLDYPILVWGLACSMHSNGFDFSRACLNNPETCQHVVEGKINLDLLNYVDRNSLTDYQKKFMVNRRRYSVDLTGKDSLETYQAEFKNRFKKVEITDDVSVVFNVPSLAKYIDQGYHWIEGIVQLVEESNKNIRRDDKELFIIKQAQATALNQYMHWVSCIWVGDQKFTNLNQIIAMLEVLSSSDQAREKFLEEVNNFINENMMSLIALPAYDCPECGKPQDEENDLPNMQNLIPLDAQSLFFTLFGRRIGLISKR